jgi:hypothetical protein
MENLIRIDCVTESPKTPSAMIALLGDEILVVSWCFQTEDYTLPPILE